MKIWQLYKVNVYESSKCNGWANWGKLLGFGLLVCMDEINFQGLVKWICEKFNEDSSENI
jgi:hypothetical protein